MPRRATNLLAGACAAGLIAVSAGCSHATAPTRSGSTPSPQAPVERALPPESLGAVPLGQALADRRSQRSFTDVPPTEQQAGTLLWATQGVTSPEGGRTAPSAGARYPLEVYWVTDEGSWQYLPDGHRVLIRAEPGLRTRLAAAIPQEAVADAPAVVVITGSPDRLRDRYGDRSERYTLIEAGHAAQNLLLAATALGLGAVPIGAVDDDAIAEVLGLAEGETAIYAIPIGWPETEMDTGS